MEFPYVVDNLVSSVSRVISFLIISMINSDKSMLFADELGEQKVFYEC